MYLSSFKNKGENKYKNNKITICGIEFSSKLESKAFLVLKDMESKGEINSLVIQPKYLLESGFYSTYYDGKKKKVVSAKNREVTYVSDFEFQKNNKVYTLEVKGLEDQKYPIKKKLFMKRYPNNTFIELKTVKDIARVESIIDELENYKPKKNK